MPCARIKSKRILAVVYKRDSILFLTHFVVAQCPCDVDWGCMCVCLCLEYQCLLLLCVCARAYAIPFWRQCLFVTFVNTFRFDILSCKALDYAEAQSHCVVEFFSFLFVFYFCYFCFKYIFCWFRCFDSVFNREQQKKWIELGRILGIRMSSCVSQPFVTIRTS